MSHQLPPRFFSQMVHLTTPATVWKYVEASVTRSEADLVMLDLEDSIPRDRPDLLDEGRANVVHALNDLDWGTRLRFFRPRGLALDPELSDIDFVLRRAGRRLEGLVLPKVDHPEEVIRVDRALTGLERDLNLDDGTIKIEVLIESVEAEERAFEIARSSRRIVGMIFGAFDFWSSLRIVGTPYSFDHPLVDGARMRIVKAASSVGVPAIAEMTVNYPTRDKSEEERAAAIAECRRDAERARFLGFQGKWTGIPAQSAVVREVFAIAPEQVAQAIDDVRAFAKAEAAGRGAVMIRGAMADRATDRMNRVILARARATGALTADVAKELGVV